MGSYVSWPSCGEADLFADPEGRYNQAFLPLDDSINVDVYVSPSDGTPNLINECREGKEIVYYSANSLPHSVAYWVTSIALNLVSNKLPFVPPEVSSEILERIGKPYSPKGSEKILLKELEKTISVADAMSLLTSSGSGYKMEPAEALELVVKHILTFKPSDRAVIRDPSLFDSQYGLQTDDVTLFARDYGLSYGEIKLAIQTAAAETYQTRAGETMVRTVEEAFAYESSTETTSLMEMDFMKAKIEASIKSLVGRKISSEKDFVIALTDWAIGTLESMQTIPDQFSFTINNVDIVFDFNSTPPDIRQKAFNKFISKSRAILERGKKSGEFPEGFVSYFETLFKKTSIYEHLHQLTAVALDEKIEARRKAVELIDYVKNHSTPLSVALSDFFDRVPESENGMRGLQIEGMEPLVVAWTTDDRTGTEYVRAYDPYSLNVGPFTFYEGELDRIALDGTTETGLMLYSVDRRVSPTVYAQDKMNLINLYAQTRVAAAEEGRQTELDRAFFSFYNDLLAAQIAAFEGNNLIIDPAEGTPQSVWENAETMSVLRPAYELLRKIRNLNRSLVEAKPDLAEVAFELLVDQRYSEVAREYLGFFRSETSQKSFTTIVERLKKAVKAGDVENAEKVRTSQLKVLVFGEMNAHEGGTNSRFVGSVRTVAFPEEFEGWAKVAKFGEASVDPELLDFLLQIRKSHGKIPSLEEARALASKKEFLRAIYEYGGVIIAPEADAPTRVQAAAELFGVAHRAEKIVWMNKALHELAYLVGEGNELTMQARKAVIEATALEKSGVLNVPAVLKDAVSPKIGLVKACELVNKTLLGEQSTYIPKQDRAGLLNKAAVDEIKAIANDAIREGRWVLSEAELVNAATLTDAEFEYFLETGPLKDTAEVRSVYRTARNRVLEHGYNGSKLKSHDSVKKLAAEPVTKVAESLPLPRTEIKIPFPYSDAVFDARPTGKDVIKKSYIIPTGLSVDFRPHPWLNGAKDIAGPTLESIWSFLTASKIVDLVSPEPEQMWEVMLQGYGTLGTAMVIDRGIYLAASGFPLSRGQGSGAGATIQGTTLSELGGNVGSAMLLARGISETAELSGTSLETAETAGLVGMASLLGGYMPAIKTVSPAAYRDLQLAPQYYRMMGSGGSFLYASKASPVLLGIGRTLNAVGLAYFIADASFGIIDSAVDFGVDRIESAVRNLEYMELKKSYHDRSFFGDSKNVGFLNRTKYTLASYSAALFPSYTKLTGDIIYDQWRLNKRDELRKEITAYNEKYQGAVDLMIKAIESADSLFAREIAYSLESDAPVSVDEIIGKLKSSECSDQSDDLGLALINWEKFASKNLSKEDQNWLFTSGSVADGIVMDSGAFTYWLQKRFASTLISLQLRISEAAAIIIKSNPAEVDEIKKRRNRLIERLEIDKKELDEISEKFTKKYGGNPWQLPS